MKFRTRQGAEASAGFYPKAFVGEGFADKEGDYFTIERLKMGRTETLRMDRRFK